MTRTGFPRSCSTAGLALVPVPAGVASSTRTPTASCCSTSAAADGLADPSGARPSADAWADLRYDDPRFRLAFARLVTHYWSHAAFLPDGHLLRGVARLGQVPAVLLHGRQDLGSPVRVAQELAEAWPGARPEVLDDVGHGAGGRMSEAVVRATDDLRDVLRPGHT